MGLIGWLRSIRNRSPNPPHPGTGNTRAIGSYGERLAESFLREKNYRILARNWRHRKDELDIVAAEGDRIVFIEVKTRPHHAKISGYDALDTRKRKALRRAANGWLNRMRPRPTTWRLDLVEVRHGPGTEPRILHYTNIPF